MSSTVPGARERLPPGSPFLFSEIPLEDTLEELERVYLRRKETARTLGEEGQGQHLDEAYAVARACLEAVLDEAHAPGSPLVALQSPPIAPRSSEAPADDAVAAESDTETEVAPSVEAPDVRNAEPLPGSSDPEAASGSA